MSAEITCALVRVFFLLPKYNLNDIPGLTARTKGLIISVLPVLLNCHLPHMLIKTISKIRARNRTFMEWEFRIGSHRQVVVCPSEVWLPPKDMDT